MSTFSSDWPLRLVVCFLASATLGPQFAPRAGAATADTFRWTSTPSNALAGLPFGAALQALDADGNSTTNFNGTVRLTALARQALPRLLISEVSALSTRAVELCNVSETPVAVSGWRLTVYDSSAWPAPKATFTFPPGSVCAPRGVFQVTSGGTAPGLYPAFFFGTNITWSSSAPDNPIAVLLRDENGSFVDFFCACGGYPVMITSPGAIPPALWQGLPTPANSTSSRSYQRLGALDHDNAVDWSATNSTLGVLNTGLRFPFSAPLRVFPVTPATALLNQGQWQGTLTLSEPASAVWLRADDGAGIVGDSSIFAVLAGPPLGLVLPPGGSEANPGVVGAGRVFIQQALPTNLTVTLSMDRGGEFALPSSVILQAGQTNVSFALTNLDDAVLDGARTVTVTASAPGFALASGTLINEDDEIGLLHVTIPASALEGDGVLAAAGKVSLNLPVGNDFAVALSSSDTNEVQVPATVFIPAGQTSAPFHVTIVNDSFLDGTRTPTVLASAGGAISGSAQIAVADNENPTLRLELAYPYEEGRGIVSNAVRVTLGGLATSNIVVSLVSLNPARVQVPPTVTVPIGQSIAYTHFIIPDDTLTNGFEVVQVNASAPGFPDASNTTNVRDNDLNRFFFVAIPGAQTSGQPFPVTAYAHTIDGYVPSTYSGTVRLRGIGHAGPVSVNPSNVTFVAGTWSGTVTIQGESRGTVLNLDDSLEHVGLSNPFDVSLVSTSSLPVSDLVYDEARGQIVAGVLSNGGVNSNRVVGIDPATGGILWNIPLGTEPSRLALADDFSFLYVGGNTTGGLARINLSTRTVALRFPLGFDGTFGPYYVEDMEVMPGNPRSVVISRKVAFGAYNQGLAVYDDRIPRSGLVGPGSFAFGYYVGFYGLSNKLYSPCAEGFRIVAVDTNGLTPLYTRGGPVYATDFEFAGGLLFGTSGKVFWPDTLRVAGTFPASGPVRPDATAGRIAFLDGNRLRVFDQNTYAELGSLNLTVGLGSPPSLIRCGADRLAFRTADNRLTILRTDLIPIASAADLSITQTSSVAVPVVGSNFTYHITVSSAGPTNATNVVIADLLPPATTFVSALASQGTCGQTSGIVNCKLGSLGNGASASVAVTVLVKSPGQLVNTARVIGGGVNPSNDVVALTNIAVFGPVLPALTEIALSAQDLAYDSASNRLWAGIGINYDQVENSLRGISLNSETNPPPIRLGDQPGRLVASANGRFLYTAVSNGISVRRLDLWNGGQAFQFVVGTFYDMKVVPDNPNALVVFLGPLVLVENGVQRPQFVNTTCRAFDFGSSPATIVATGDIFTRDLFVMNIVATGIVGVSTNQLLFGAGVGYIRFVNGRIFSAAGDVVDAVSKTRLATLPVTGSVEVAPAGQVFYLVQNYPNWILIAYDAATLNRLWAYPISGVTGLASSLVRCGPGILAFRSEFGQVFVLNTSLLPHLVEPDLEVGFSPSVSAGPAGSPFTFTGIVDNHGPAPAMNVVVTNHFSAGTLLLGHSTAHGACTNIGGELVCQLGNLAPGGQAAFVLTVMKTNAGTLVVTATGASDTLDPAPTNNIATFTAPIDVPPSADVSVRDSFTLVGGGRLAYTVVISNAGPDIAENVALVDVYAIGATLISATASQGTIATNFGHIAANLGSVPAGATATVSLLIQPPLTSTWLNRAEVSTTTPDPVPPNNDSVSVATPGGSSLITKVPLLADDFVYDAVRRRLYALVPPNGGDLSNSIVTIDPDTGEFAQQLRFSEPVSKLAVTEDGQFLYAALTQTGGVLRIRISNWTPEARIQLPNDPTWGTRVAFDLAPLPGHPESIAVSSRWVALGYNPGIEIYDGTTIRPNSILISSGVSYFFLGFPNPPDRMYAHGFGGFHVLPVDSSGVTFTGPGVGGIPGTDFVLDSGQAWFDSGHALDPEAQIVFGSLPVGVGFIAPDLASNRVYFLPQNGSTIFNSTMTVRSFHPTTFSELWSFSIPAPPGVERGFLKLRSGEFAIRTDGSRSRILILRTPLLDQPSADLSLTATDSPDPVNDGGIITYALTLRNEGPWNAADVVVSNALPPGTSFISASASLGNCLLDNGTILCSVGFLANGSSATLDIAVRATVSGLLSNQFVASHGFFDPNPVNSMAIVPTTVNPAPSLSIADAAVLEGSNRTPVSFSVTLSAPSTLPVSVNFATANGTAIAGPDYDATSGLVTFAPGIAAQTITLSPGIRGNTTVGTNRFFRVNLSNSMNAVFARQQATAFIIEDDFNSLRVLSTSVVEGNTGRTNALFNFSLSPASSNFVTVDYATMDGTAIAGSDYLARSGTLVIPPGSTNQSLKIPVLGDLCTEPEDTFFLQLSAPVNALLVVGETFGRIVNDDPNLSLRILSLTPVGDAWRIQFRTACDRNYRLQRSESLAPNSWITIVEPIAGTGGTVTVLDTMAPPAGQAFYRIERLP